MANIDYGTTPSVPEKLPDGRLRATRFGRVLEHLARSEESFRARVLPAEGTPLPGFPTLKLIGFRYSPAGDADTALGVTETYEELIRCNRFQDMSISFPGVRPSAYTTRDDYPFRTSPESRVVTVRIATAFFTVTDPRSIQLVPRFDPRSILTGDAVSVLDDNSTTTSDEYLAWVASGQEFVERCIRRQIFGKIWARDTYYVKAE
jgi:hypothetical protein